MSEPTTPAPKAEPAAPPARRSTIATWAFPIGLVVAGMITGVLLLAAVQILLEGRLGTTDVPGDAADQSPDLFITLTPGLLTASIRQSVERGNSPVPLDNVRVVTKKDRVVVLGDVSVRGVGVPGTIEMRPVVEEGQVRMKVVSAKLGPLPVPGNVERIVEEPINSRVQAAVAGYPATVTGVTSGPEGVTVTARVKVTEPHPTATTTAAPSPAPTATATATPVR